MKFVQKKVVEEDFDLVNAFAHLLASVHNNKDTVSDFSNIYFNYNGKPYALQLIVSKTLYKDIDNMEFRS